MTTLPTILVPQGAEYQAVCRGLKSLPDGRVVALPVGPEPVQQFLEQWCPAQANMPPIVVMGLCGSLRSELAVGDAVIYQACLDGQQTLDIPRLNCDAPLSSSLRDTLGSAVTEVTALTCDRIIHQSSEKQSLAQMYKADVVDMEGFAALKVLQQYKIPVAMLRVVSDDIDHDLPDLAEAISPEGKLMALPMALGMLRQPVGALRLIQGSLRGLKVIEQLSHTLARAAAENEP